MSLTRAKLSAFIAQGLATRRLSARDAARARAELAAVPDSFFRELEAESRFGTYGGGSRTIDGRLLVPPAGVPEFLACEGTGASLACRDVNGSQSLPVGSGVYAAQPTADWRPAPPEHTEFRVPPGAAPLTPAEARLLMDPAILTTGGGGGSSGTGTSGSAP